jgi:hypothetical protein
MQNVFFGFRGFSLKKGGKGSPSTVIVLYYSSSIEVVQVPPRRELATLWIGLTHQ